MSQKENIFCFNHIDKSKTKEEIQEIKELYKYYHYKYWCHRQAFKHFKKLNLAINISSTGLIVIGAVAGALTANPAILASISGAGLVLKQKLAYSTYQKILLDLCTALRGGPFDKNSFLKELNM